MITDKEAGRAAAAANAAYYDSGNARDYRESAPHHKHESLRRLYIDLITEVYERAARYGVPRILDLGAGEGSATLPFLALGADVTAADISPDMLEALELRCEEYGEHLETVRGDIFDVIERFKKEGRRYDIAAANSLLHHVPDYLGLIRALRPLLSGHGQFFSFQDPLRFDSVGLTTRSFSKVAHYSWRVFQGDLAGGLTRYRRRRHEPDRDNPEDNAEYHYFRNGVDQDAIREEFEANGFTCRIVRYFSIQPRVGQRFGEWLRLENNFASMARRQEGVDAGRDGP